VRLDDALRLRMGRVRSMHATVSSAPIDCVHHDSRIRDPHRAFEEKAFGQKIVAKSAGYEYSPRRYLLT
jgi:hypothetical protein